MFQEEFQVAVDEITLECREYFLDRLKSIYITGSVSTNEAIIGESDLDFFGYISDKLIDKDKRWIYKIEEKMNKRFKIFDGIHLNIKSVLFYFFKRE